MPSPALAYPFRTAADQIEREVRNLAIAHEHGECHGRSAAQLRGSIIEDVTEMMHACGPDEFLELARVVASFARRVC